MTVSCDDVQSEDEILSKEYLLFDHHPCFAHMLNLIVKDGIGKAGQIGNVIKKCSKLVSFVRKSAVATDILQGQKKVEANNATRWNSQLKMIRSVLAVDESKLSDLEGAPCKLSSHDRNVLQDVIGILEPFEEATDLVQVSNVPSAGYVLPCIRGLNDRIKQISLKYNTTFVNTLKQSLAKRVTYYETDNTYILAAMLDPRFKLEWCPHSKKENFMLMLQSTSEKVAPSALEGEQTSDPPPKKRKALFSFMPQSGDSRDSGSSRVANQVKDYLNDKIETMETNPALYWKEHEKKYPALAEVAKEVLSVPASSAPVERLFSVAGKVFTPERCRLTDTRFEQLMFIRCNNNSTT